MNTERAHFLDDLTHRLRCESSVEFAVLFGSRVTNETHPSSDLDLAVKFIDSFSSQERFQKQCFLSGTLQQSGKPFVDVSDIDDLPLSIVHDAVNGEFLCGNEQAFQEFKSEIEDEFKENKTKLQHHHNDVIARIAERGLHG